MSFSATLIASPIPRDPPVTIATRAMFLSSSPRRRLSLRQPACKFALDQSFQHCDAFSGIVQAIEQRETLAAGTFKALAATNAELFQRLQTVGGKSGRGDGQALHPPHRISGERFVGGGFQPLRPPEARLERDVDLAPQRIRQ